MSARPHDSRQLSKLQGTLIGSRSITDSQRKDQERAIERKDSVTLPHSVRQLCDRMLEMLDHDSDGFRRRNMPALTHRYFQDMAVALRTLSGTVKPGGVCAMVVGQNSTTLGGTPLMIDTPSLLADVGSADGWSVRELIPFDTYPRFDLHHRNSIKAESLVLLEKR